MAHMKYLFKKKKIKVENYVLFELLEHLKDGSKRYKGTFSLSHTHTHTYTFTHTCAHGLETCLQNVLG